uniref:Diphthamide biosynthesis protein 4 n=1 Tax=Tetraselmis sp. GSL018 TaxID=582737 RepID=A0A061RZC3_9CHLO
MYNSETTHYDVLGVPHTANQSEIRSAYKAAVLTYHPDRQGGNMSNDKLQSQRGLTFEMIQSAWEELKDAQKRREYDLGLSLKQTANNTPVSEEVSKEEMEVSNIDGEVWYSYPCRCGAAFEIPHNEIPGASPASVLVGCGSCSLFIRVVAESGG